MLDISNTVSAPVLGGIALLIGAIGKALHDLYQLKLKADAAKKASEKAAEKSEKAVQNTANVSNGFARNVDNKLDHIINKQSDLEATIRAHLQWHVEQSGKG